MKALIVDGRMAGAVREMTRGAWVNIEPVEPGVSMSDLGLNDAIQQVVYTPFRVILFDRILWVASCGLTLKHESVLEHILTPQARELLEGS